MGTKAKNAEGKTRSTRTEQVGVAEDSNYSRWEGGTGGTSPTDGNFGVGIAGAAGKEADSAITGGILEQLIQDAEDQLQSSVECIEWYEREREKHQERLNNLKQLQALRQQSDPPQIEPSEE
ncbi:hypothetical protein [Egbenema bharatensis]|uniref:hypothetical protein n=1 Tax=Egbenema bharatensis TaxID=3463334 RepID=UPI003A89A791